MERDRTRICASLGLRMKFKTLCYPVFGRIKTHAALPMKLADKIIRSQNDGRAFHHFDFELFC